MEEVEGAEDSFERHIKFQPDNIVPMIFRYYRRARRVSLLLAPAPVGLLSLSSVKSHIFSSTFAQIFAGAPRRLLYPTLQKRKSGLAAADTAARKLIENMCEYEKTRINR